MLIAVAIALLAGGAYWALAPEGSRKKGAFEYETAAVERGPIVAKVTASGTLSALITVQVGSQVSGRIQQLFVDFNSPVKKGQVLAKIDPQLFSAALEQAKANFVAARANLTKAKVEAEEAGRQLVRTKDLADRKLIAAAELDTARAARDAKVAQVEAASGMVAQAQASLHQAEVNLAYTTIHSPIDGVVISRNVDVGQTVAASLQAPTLFVLAEDLRKMQVDTSVAEADIGKLHPGMDAAFVVDAYPTQRFVGKVRQIRNAPQTVQNVVTYDAVIDVDNPDLLLKPGMTANVTFVIAELPEATRLPNAALRFKPPPEMLSRAGGRGNGEGARSKNPGEREGPPGAKTVWVLRAAGPEPVKVKTGVSDGSVSELIEGELSVGDRLIVGVAGGLEQRRPGGGGGPMRLF